eukprot:5237806-Pyramimonas_sp.AAC.3
MGALPTAQHVLSQDVPLGFVVDLELLSRRQVVNHYRATKDITIKALMVRTLRSYCETSALVDIHDLIPETYICVPGGGLGDERAMIDGACRASH